ncbi:uncharacterized protein N7482_002040 [Penicillium canariense]|uniref:Uncharacterized protein n=1 Tax=Penicillium canariense TaxID=189055 RepID=A0A9W9LTI9_9EURO|nr:uncharacterized protein N7482_002040 [Penicillium canariense]KAJ5176163.1 hypothetical protein N7482_002040 [Penicillium canariense]
MHPNCQERSHYPIFNPQDPRHNPHLQQPFCRSESQASSDSPRQTHWAHDFPRRSLHKARSGLLALRAGLFRRTARQGSDPIESEARPISRQAHGRQSTYGFSEFSASTQEDLSFGVDLYRTDRDYARALDDANRNSMARFPFFHPLANTISAPEPAPSSCTSRHDAKPAFVHLVSMPVDEPPAYKSCRDHAFSSQPSENAEMDTGDELLVDEEIQKRTADPSTHPVASADRETIESVISSSTDHEDMGGTSLLCDNKEMHPEQGQVFLKAWKENEEPASRAVGELKWLSEPQNVQPLEDEQNITNSSRGSLTLPDYNTPSISDSETSHRRGSIFIKAEAFVSQERLLLGEDLSGPKASVSPVLEPRRAADVQIAFPGVYRELHEQWVRETQMSPAIDPGSPGRESMSGASQVPSLSDATSSRQADSQPRLSTELPWSLDSHLGSGLVDILDRFQAENRLIPFTQLAHPGVTTVRCMQDPVTFPCTMDDYTRQPVVQATNERSPEYHHSFGIHISERNEPTPRDVPPEISRREILRRSFAEQRHIEPRQFFSSLGPWGAADAQCDDSDIPTNYTCGSATSASATSPTSMSSAPWSPLDSPIDEEVLFRNLLRDEYYIGDGKTSSYYPDGGDEPVKGRFFGDGRIHSGPGLDRTPSSRLRQVTQMSSSNTLSRPFPPDPQEYAELENESTGDSIPSS